MASLSVGKVKIPSRKLRKGLDIGKKSFGFGSSHTHVYPADLEESILMGGDLNLNFRSVVAALLFRNSKS